MKTPFSAAAVIFLALDSIAAAAQRITASQQGCPLDLVAKVATEVRCGKRSTVAFAVEWHGTDVAQLEKWFRVAGCADGEAATEAVWVADRCHTKTSGKAHGANGLELRGPGDYPARRLVAKRTLNVQPSIHGKRASDDDDTSDDDTSDDDTSNDDTSDDTSDSSDTSTSDKNNDSDDKTTTSTKSTSTSTSTSTTSSKTTSSKTTSSESTTSTTTTSTSSTLTTSTTSLSTTTSLASTTSSNPYVFTRVADNSTSLLTCMTETITTTTACSSKKVDHKYTTSCATAAVTFPTCLDGLSCSFSQTNGALSCYQKGGIPVYGKIILVIMGLAASLAISAILTLCFRERSQVKRYRQAAEEKALLAAMGGAGAGAGAAAKTVGVTIEEVGAGTSEPTTHSDTAPLMHADETERTAEPPQIVVSGGYTPTEASASFPPGRYDPFADDDRHRY